MSVGRGEKGLEEGMQIMNTYEWTGMGLSKERMFLTLTITYRPYRILSPSAVEHQVVEQTPASKARTVSVVDSFCIRLDA